MKMTQAKVHTYDWVLTMPIEGSKQSVTVERCVVVMLLADEIDVKIRENIWPLYTARTGVNV